jgi:hypothetical protein
MSFTLDAREQDALGPRGPHRTPPSTRKGAARCSSVGARTDYRVAWRLSHKPLSRPVHQSPVGRHHRERTQTLPWMGARPLDTDKSDVLSHRSVMSAVRRLYATASMELDSESLTAAFHGCGSAVRADFAPADAWSSSAAGVSWKSPQTVASTRERACGSAPWASFRRMGKRGRARRSRSTVRIGVRPPPWSARGRPAGSARPSWPARVGAPAASS